MLTLNGGANILVQHEIFNVVPEKLSITAQKCSIDTLGDIIVF